ncbi:MAG: hypothetical protein A3A80_02425 [Candidatus Terrybacteria bacterium RIFCSPLOWO2_01_FULL_44_24]|uniref:UDP-N-acetylglucosamine kinase n=1 Tax=Candidatus Terrybacteria bacterium RIFCSPHIGHO2_01_FULL_43_35 TaxID=1802361 RepID=A0A1G2PED1_9BACT|nr:MAG: hypothetical protein A2828_02220 [Candidatus Terrybacteria bacterium RIFCSPHIGHO2_01_FULL_43_35]OHA50933.1 MAG: hypothetical protein A3A80_02425 [Candidatus Terrybacteria bacterium RIFCSPLOWO2_01_FULL_44_24]
MSGKQIGFAIALIGQKAAGKSEAARYFQQIATNPFAGSFEFQIFRLSDPLREIARQRGVENPTTNLLQDIGDELRATHGSGALAKMVLEMALENGQDYNNFVIIDGVRNPGEMQEIRRATDNRCVFIGVTANQLIRFKRFKKREEERDGGAIALKDFRQLDRRDKGYGQDENGQRVNDCLKEVSPDCLIANNGDLWQFKHKLHNIWINRINVDLLETGPGYS